MTKDTKKIDASILDNEEVHNEIKDTVLSYIIFEAKYMPDEEAEEVTMQVKDLLKNKINNKKDRIHNELCDILKSKVMYDVEIMEYGNVGQTVVKIMNRIMDKWARKLENELYIVVGIKRKKKSIFKRLFAVCMSDQSSDKEVLPQNRLTKKEIKALRQVRQVVRAKKDDVPQIRRINNTQCNKDMLLRL